MWKCLIFLLDLVSVSFFLKIICLRVYLGFLWFFEVVFVSCKVSFCDGG